MEAAFTKIFNNALGGMGKALENWKEMVILSKLDDKNKKNLIGGLQRFHDGCMKDKVRRINHKFYLNMKLFKISTAFYTKLLMTGKWKSLKAWDGHCSTYFVIFQSDLVKLIARCSHKNCLKMTLEMLLNDLGHASKRSRA